ncbi:hypothetical protein TNCV_3156231 [Trichonephila clavipes]|nr:hypothetical protein TNCV_3156231 [Trichonephila clavipes]
MGFGIRRQMRDGEIVSPDDPDQDNGTKLLNYCIVIGPGQGIIYTFFETQRYLMQSLRWRMRANVMRTNANILPCPAVPADENFLWNELDEKISL